MLKQFILSSFIILTTFSCGSSENNKNDQPAAKNADSAITQDTIDIRPPHPEPGLPPGTARITGYFLAVDKDHPKPVMKFKVSKVNEYGSSAPAIGTNSILEIRIPAFLESDIQKLKAGKKIVCLINYRQFLNSGNDNSQWVLKEITSEGLHQ